MRTVEVTPRAAAQIEAAAQWWAENRLSAPTAIAEDFERAVALLARRAGIGTRSRSRRFAGVRRLFLSRVGYHVYYRIDGSKVVVLAFWHASRGTGPGL